MSYQNINQYNYPKLKLQVVYDGQDMCLASDEVDYNQEVVFSPFIIGVDDGKKLPINFDLNDTQSSINLILKYGEYSPNNVVVSKNYYQPEGLDINCFSSDTTCDIGLTGIDNGLVSTIKNQTLNFTNGLFPNSFKFNRMYYDRRFKLIQTTSNVPLNNKFSGITEYTSYEMVSKNNPDIGRYVELYGGFYQGFYKLFGYDYEILPERMDKGWSVEMLLKPRFVDEYQPKSGYTTLNKIYPNNKNIFFYMGLRSENKFYHHADGSPKSDPNYVRVTSNLKDCFETCSCCDSNVKNSRCQFVYPPRTKGGSIDPHLNYNCNKCGSQNYSQQRNTCGECGNEECDNCGWMCFEHNCNGKTHSIENTCEKDPKFDVLSNNISFRLCGDPKNPGIGVRVLKITGGCETTGTCVTGQTYVTGYTIQDICTPPIYTYCEKINPSWLNFEHWFQVNVVFERYRFLDFCDLRWFGGLDRITRVEILNSLVNDSVSLITPPYSNNDETAKEVEIVELNDRWLDETKFRMGRLKIYVNGRIFYVIEDFEEVIPRPLNTDKEKQVAVPFNMSWGGGTQGLRENLTLSSCTQTNIGDYIQDPECFPENVLKNTSLNKIKTNILLEENFAGTFDGAISQFRFYTEPLSSPEVKHNFKILKDKFRMFNPDCPTCDTSKCVVNDFNYNFYQDDDFTHTITTE
jgi:hypothetical protein